MKQFVAILVFISALACVHLSHARDTLTVDLCHGCAYGFKCVSKNEKVCYKPVCYDSHDYECIAGYGHEHDCKFVEKCHDIPDKKCEKEKKEVCDDDIVKKECKKVPFKVCKKIPKVICKNEKKQVCKKVPKQVCKDVYKQVCYDAPCKDEKVCDYVKKCDKVCIKSGKGYSHGHGHGLSHGGCFGYKDVCKSIPVCKFVKKCYGNKICKSVPDKQCHTIYEDKCYYEDNKVCSTIYEDVCTVDYTEKCDDIKIKGKCKYIYVDVCKDYSRKECKKVKVCPDVKCPDYSVCKYGQKCVLRKKCDAPVCKYELKYGCVKHH